MNLRTTEDLLWQWQDALRPDECGCWEGLTDCRPLDEHLSLKGLSCNRGCDRGWYYSTPPEWWAPTPDPFPPNVHFTVITPWSDFCDLAYFAVTGEGRLKKEEVADDS